MTTHETLCATLRTLDAEQMTTDELVDACLSAVPSAEIEDIAAALQQVGEEQLAEAKALKLYGRCRRAGITRVIDGGDAA